MGGVGLAGDELREEGGDIFGGRVLEVEDLVAGVGVGLDVELGDELVEERILARVGDEDDLVGAVVGVVGGAGAELVLERALEDGAELVDEVGGLGGFERVELGVEAGGGRAVEGLDEALDALEVGDGIGDEGGVGFFQNDHATADTRGEKGLQLRHEFVDAEEIELEDLGGNLAGGGLVEGGTGNHLGRLGANLGEGDDLEETIAEGSDADLVEGEERLDRENQLGARNGAVDDERVFRGGQGGGAEDTAPGVEFEGGEDAVDGEAADLEGRDELVGVGLHVGRLGGDGHGAGGGCRGLRGEGGGQDEEGGGEAQADVKRSHAKWCGGRDGAPGARGKGAKSKRMGL